MRKPSGLTLILGATAVAAVAGYLVIWLVPLQIGLASYKTFGLFWSAMYLIVGTLAGLQQEVTRGTVPRDAGLPLRASLARNFGLIVAALVFALIVVSAPLWVSSLFPADGWRLVWPLAFATSSYVLVATLAGTLYGLARWWPLALMISVDALLRLAAVGIVSTVTRDAAALAWAAAAPFLLTIVLLWPAFRSSVVGKASLDVEYRALTWNVARTMVAAASTGILVSGLPVVIGVAAAAEPPALVASLFLAITITRAPVIVVVMSLQSYLLIRFRDHREEFGRTLLVFLGLLAAGGVVLALVAWLIGPAVFGLLYAGEVSLAGWFYGVLVLSSALIGSLTVTGAALLSRARHFGYTLGWLVAALTTIACFLPPIGIMGQILTAVIAGPVSGLAIHAGFLLSKRSAQSRTPRP